MLKTGYYRGQDMKHSAKIEASATECGRNAIEEFYRLKHKLIFGEPVRRHVDTRGTFKNKGLKNGHKNSKHR